MDEHGSIADDALHRDAAIGGYGDFPAAAVARAAEIHDQDTANHIQRTNEYSYVLARRLGMPDAFCDEIRYSAQLHDVGKMSVNTALLKKPGALEPRERDEIIQHSDYGYQNLPHSDRLQMAAEVAQPHHEQWGGGGYPNRLVGEAIPIAARIVALADVYDALRAKRSYKPAFSHARTRKILLEGDERLDPASHFDPKLLAVFAEHHGELDEVWRAFHAQPRPARAVNRELFTIGYEGSRLADVVAALSDAGVTTLIDVREAPWSRRPEFAKRALGEAMAAAGIGYRHMKALGTPKAGRDAARAGDIARFHAIFDAQLATEAAQTQLGEVAALVATERPCLMCYERDPDRCHRSIVAARLAETSGLAVRHLDIPRGDDSQLTLL